MNTKLKTVDEVIKGFVINELVGDATASVAEDTPLLELGIVTSLNIARLISFVRTELDISIGVEHIVGTNFRDIASICSLVRQLSSEKG